MYAVTVNSDRQKTCKNVLMSSCPSEILLRKIWAQSAMNGQLTKLDAKIPKPMEANSWPHDTAIYIDGQITLDQTAWGFTVKQGGRTILEDRGAHKMKSSLTMELEAVTLRSDSLSARTDHSIMALTACKKEEWTKGSGKCSTIKD